MNRTIHKTAVLLIGHGSPRPEVKSAFCALADLVRAADGNKLVETAFLSCGEPDIACGIDRCVAQGAQRIVLCPYFLFAGSHVRNDLPAAMVAAGQRYPGLELLLAEPLGVHPKLAEVVVERVAQALGGPTATAESSRLDGAQQEPVE